MDEYTIVPFLELTQSGNKKIELTNSNGTLQEKIDSNSLIAIDNTQQIITIIQPIAAIAVIFDTTTTGALDIVGDISQVNLIDDNVTNPALMEVLAEEILAGNGDTEHLKESLVALSAQESDPNMQEFINYTRNIRDRNMKIAKSKNKQEALAKDDELNNKKLETHHPVPICVDPSRRADSDNLDTMPKDNHGGEHRKMAKKNRKILGIDRPSNDGL
jgi:hypothetical protein